MLGVTVLENIRFYFDGHDLVVELAFGLGPQRVLMASIRELIAVCAGHAVLALHLFTGASHAHVDLRQVIHHPGIWREFVARHRNHAHGFRAAGDDDLGAAGTDSV